MFKKILMLAVLALSLASTFATTASAQGLPECWPCEGHPLR